MSNVHDKDEIILVIDEGTTSVRACAYDRNLRCVASESMPVSVCYPFGGAVEQSAEEIWQSTEIVCQRAISRVGGAEKIAAIGITNQRETTIVWDTSTGKPLCPALVWQDRRTDELCAEKRLEGWQDKIRRQTGLTIDPYFSASKLQHILEHIAPNQADAKIENLRFGTVDCWLLWKLTGGRVHATDVTNASRTMLRTLDVDPSSGWDEKLLNLFKIPQHLMPRIQPSGSEFGATETNLFGKSIPILTAIGDQQASLVGQKCLSKGKAKITYGTGAFLVVNTGHDQPPIDENLLGTVGYSIGDCSAYALEGSIFNAGTVMQWLRDDLHFLSDSSLSESMAQLVPDSGGVNVVPAFTGLGAPHWNPKARGLISGLTRGTTVNHIVRAALESIALQTFDLIEAFRTASCIVNQLKVDGGMSKNAWMVQNIADICDLTVTKPDEPEMTALGCAVCVATMLEWTDFGKWENEPSLSTRFNPNITHSERSEQIDRWHDAVARANL